MRPSATIAFALACSAGPLAGCGGDDSSPSGPNIEHLRAECELAVECLQAECSDADAAVAALRANEPDMEAEPDAWEEWDAELQSAGEALRECQSACFEPTPLADVYDARVKFTVLCDDPAAANLACALGYALRVYDEDDDSCDGLYDGA